MYTCGGESEEFIVYEIFTDQKSMQYLQSMHNVISLSWFTTKIGSAKRVKRRSINNQKCCVSDINTGILLISELFASFV